MLAGGALAVLLATGVSTSVGAASGTAFVRVNQVGYPADASKRAYLLASAAETGAMFRVRNAAGTVVYSAPVGASLGSWSRRYPFVYALDFATVATAGTYVIGVSGPLAASSPRFRIDSGARLYARPLANALSFFQAERDGPDFIRSALRTAAGHLHDAGAM